MGTQQQQQQQLSFVPNASEGRVAVQLGWLQSFAMTATTPSMTTLDVVTQAGYKRGPHIKRGHWDCMDAEEG